MDLAQDHKFLNESIANKFNPMNEGEFFVIQTLPATAKLYILHRGFDLKEATGEYELENFAHDYTSFGLRIFYEGKLWRVGHDGKPTYVSKQQQWIIHEDYLITDDCKYIDSEIKTHDCSYPYFSCTRSILSKCNGVMYCWETLTCLEEDHGRQILWCPNCSKSLDNEDEDLEEDEEDIPITCVGCKNYHGKFYDSIQLVCAINPFGCNDLQCEDYANI